MVGNASHLRNSLKVVDLSNNYGISAWPRPCEMHCAWMRHNQSVMEHIITGISKNSLKVTFVTNSTHFDKMMRFGNLIEDLQCENGRQRILETLFPNLVKSKGADN